jgi:ketosteroid isomerase-like protein
MSEENLALAREYFETFNAGGLDAVEQFWHPEIELFDPPNLPDADRFVGVAAVRRRTESYMEVAGWSGEFDVQEYVDAGEEVVVISTVHGGSARFETGIVPIDVTVGQVLLFDGGKLRRFRSYLSRAEALEAVGLSA